MGPTQMEIPQIQAEYVLPTQQSTTEGRRARWALSCDPRNGIVWP